MASFTIRNLDDDVKIQLRTRAAGDGRLIALEARQIPSEAVARGAEPNSLAAFMRGPPRFDQSGDDRGHRHERRVAVSWHHNRLH